MNNSTDKQYNGWANYETWLMALWLGNDQWLDEEINRIVSDSQEEEAYYIGKYINEYVDEMEEVTATNERGGFVADLLGAAMQEIDWTEIAQARLDDMSE